MAAEKPAHQDLIKHPTGQIDLPRELETARHGDRATRHEQSAWNECPLGGGLGRCKTPDAMKLPHTPSLNPTRQVTSHGKLNHPSLLARPGASSQATLSHNSDDNHHRRRRPYLALPFLAFVFRSSFCLSLGSPRPSRVPLALTGGIRASRVMPAGTPLPAPPLPLPPQTTLSACVCRHGTLAKNPGPITLT